MVQAGLNIIYFCACYFLWCVWHRWVVLKELLIHQSCTEPQRWKATWKMPKRIIQNVIYFSLKKVSWKYANIKKKSFSITVFTVNIQSSQSHLHSIYKNIKGTCCWKIHNIAEQNWGTCFTIWVLANCF